MQVTFILSMVFAIVIAVFALANSGTVTISFIFKSFEMSQAVVILVSSVIGAVVVFMLNLVSKAKSAVKTKGLNKQIKELESQLKNCQLNLEQKTSDQLDQMTENNSKIEKEDAETR